VSAFAQPRPWSEARVDPVRLMRAIGCYRVVPGSRYGYERQYAVIGGVEEYAVDLRDEAACPCDCGDHTWRDLLCKHALAALLYEGNQRVVLALGQLFRDAWFARGAI
jgi:hypothetical protein